MTAANPHDRRALRDVFVCADVGGTFTDCFVGWTDSAGRKAIRRLKVLSSGLLRCRVRRRIADDTLQLDLPAEIHRSVRHPEQHVGDLPDHFFRTAELSLIVQGGALSMGTVERFESSRSEVTLRPTEDAARTLIDENAVIEIDCHCEAPVLATRLLLGIPIDQPLPPASVRLGTTRGTNALLTRTGASTALVVNQGFGDALLIGEQDRPELFDLTIDKGIPLADTIVEIRGRMNAKGRETETIVEREIEQAFMTLKERGVESIAICLLHAYLNPIHEKRVESIARRLGLTFVSRSSEVAPLIKFVARAETTSLDAYLNPILTAYVDRVRSQFGGSDHVQLDLMTSGGNLVPSARFRGRDSVLSGPAGGVIGLQTVASRARCPLAIGLDMGGTSTDVSRWNGKTARRYESRINGLRVLTPMMDIHTVAAGGGSICDFQGGRLVVGPESAGASPGPACYGAGGPLTVTDINLLLGRLIDSRFPLPLDRAASEERLRHVAGRMPDRPANDLELAEGFFEIAVTHMAEAVRAITTARGVDVRDHALIGFGGAAAQHVCRIADALGIRRIIDHPQASLLSALGMGAASIGVVKTVGIYRPLHETTPEQVRDQGRRLLESLDRQASDGGSRAKPTSSDADLQETFVASRFEADLRYAGTDASIAMPIDDWMRSVETSDGLEGLAERFHEAHQKRFGYLQRERPIEWVSLRCERLRANKDWERRLFEREITAQEPRSTSRNQTRVFCQGTMEVFDVLQRDELPPDFLIPSRSLVVSDQSTLVVEPGWQGTVANDGTITLIPCKRSQPGSTNRRDSNDAVAMEIVARRLQSIADSMGEVLRRTAVSVNVKERLDFSCAVFDRNGLLIANAPHVPVHLGAMGHTVRHLATVFPDMSPGDCYVSNDPYAGGSHLPDVTVVTPVFVSSEDRAAQFFVASRAHHAEIGGRTPGSMPPSATCLEEEGVLISAFALHDASGSHEAELAALLRSARYPSRNVEENLADLRAQVAAGRHGAEQLTSMVAAGTLSHINAMVHRLMDVADQSVRRWIRSLPDQPLRFSDQLDDGTLLTVCLRREGERLRVDFDGTASVHRGGFNATESIVSSALLYVMRCFCESNLPLCEGALRSIDLVIPTGLLSPSAGTDPSQSPAVVSGNVETSQRIVDVLLGALGQSTTGDLVLRAVAASQGTMNNVLIGNERFGYYETIGGGAGATVFGPGADAVHTHMTNTRITDVEVLESRLPVRLRTFHIRQRSGGLGRHRGGDGLVREYEFLDDLTVSLITSRRTTQPYGVCGGGPAQSGLNTLLRADGTESRLGFAETLQVSPGDRLRIETPGGGGWGEPE